MDLRASVLVADDDEAIRQVIAEAMSAPGVSGHLSKPIDLDRLLDTVGRLAVGARRQR